MNVLKSLARTVDVVRSLHNVAGDRPYRVFLCRTRWSGEYEGEGSEGNISEVEILPRPFVKGLGSVALNLNANGMTDDADLTISEISYAKFSDQDLNPTDLHENEQFFVEIRPEDGTRRIRAFPAGKPVLHVDGSPGWTMKVRIQQHARLDNGVVYG